MANLDLQKFLEDRLLALHPEEDVSSGSPAQLKFIQPVLSYLGTDPFETDVETFISDRFAQEFPDIYASNPGAIRDVFVNPLRLILEPWKRETQLIRRNQSLSDPTILSDEDADRLVANHFVTRDEGGYASGTVRIYYSNPIDQQIEITNRFYSADGLNFFPTALVAILAEQMVFNRDGSFFYIDVPVQAEGPGAEYNLAVGMIVGMDGLAAAVRVTNLQRFTGGVPRQSTEALVAAAEVSLNEQSLVTSRGAVGRLLKTFSGALQAAQVIGAKDVEMQRDVLVGTSPGHAWVTGQVDLYRNVAYVRARTLDGLESDVPQPGDDLYIYLAQSSIGQALRFLRLRIEELLVGPLPLVGSAFQLAYFVRWSDPDDAISLRYSTTADFYDLLPSSFEGGFSKRGQLKISSLPGQEAVDLSVADQEVHLYGHADVYIRPSVVETATAVLSSASDLGMAGASRAQPHFAVERTRLTTTADSNQVGDAEGLDFVAAGVRIGDLLSIESGADAGVYRICRVATASLYLSQVLKATSPSVLHYRITRTLRTPLFEPKILRFPFGDEPRSILATVIGSTRVIVSSSSQVDLIAFGARVGDTLRILSGPDAGDYSITGFDETLGGKGIILDRAMTSTGNELPIQVFTPMEAVEKPLLRVKEVMLLDSARQSTGITIPPADPLATVPLGKLTSAQVLATSTRASGYVLPDLDGLLDGFTNQAANPGRYSSGIDTPEGVYISIQDDVAASELDLLAEVASGVTVGESAGKCSFFLMTPESLTGAINRPPADPKPGEALSIKNGPNKGDYLVRSVRQLRYTTVDAGGTRENWVYLVQIYGEFPVDPLKRLIEFIQEVGGGQVATGLEFSLLVFPLAFPSFFSTWYGTTLASRLYDTLLNAGVQLASESSAEATFQEMIEAMTACSYEYGTPARGAFRTYFREPTFFEQYTGESLTATVFSLTSETGELLRYRPDPRRYTRHQLWPPRTSTDASPLAYPRDLIVSGGGQNATFTDTSRLTLFTAGVQNGDLLVVHEELPAYPSAPATQVLVSTFANSPQITVLSGAGDIFSETMLGSLLFLDEGSETGGYRIARYIDAQNVMLDRPLQTSSPTVLRTGATTTLGVDTGVAYVDGGAGAFSAADVGRYITVFGIDYLRMGSFEIASVIGGGSRVTLTLPSGYTFPTSITGGRWAITEAPAEDPVVLTRDESQPTIQGTSTVAGVPIRIYAGLEREFSLENISPSATTSSATVSPYDGGNPSFNLKTGIKQPYRILRCDVRRVSPTEMSGNREGSLYYVDTEVVSLTPSSAANVGESAYLTIEEGTFDSIGYRHAVADKTLTYSMSEDGFLDLPREILPVGTDDAADSYVRVLGTPVQITYETVTVLPLVQDFIDSAEDRVAAANMLVRNFLPAYVSYDASYSGGSTTAVVAADITRYLNSIPAATALDVSEIQTLVSQRGGNLDTPTKIMVTIHDWSRRMWAEFTSDKLGGPLPSDTAVPYDGTPRVTYFIAGPNVSEQETVPEVGERINLVRR